MNQSKELTPQGTKAIRKKPKFSEAITTESYKNMIKNTLVDENRCRRFVSSITSAVANTPALQECISSSILSAALLGESLNLPPSPQLGKFYMVPFKRKAKKDRDGNVISEECTIATFVLGYKGYIELALRSGHYRKMNVIEIKKGELKSFDPLTETIDAVIIQDAELRENAPTDGYFAMFELTNGFRKTMYWSKNKMIAHADKYSPAFSAEDFRRLERGEIPDKDLWKYSSFWYKDFDEMAKKTMLRQIISHWGIMSIEMQIAYERDGAIIEMDSNGNTVPNFDYGDIIEQEAPSFETDSKGSLNLDEL